MNSSGMQTAATPVQEKSDRGSSPWVGSAAGTSPIAAAEDLGRALNTALISTRAETSRDWMAEIQRLMETPAFHSLMSSVRHLARTQGVSEAAAAEDLVRTVRALDHVWREYVFQEGLEKLKS